MLEKRIAHGGLNAFRVIRGQTQYDLEMKARAQEATWAAMWKRRVDSEAKRNARAARLEQRELSKLQLEEAKRFAVEVTRELDAARERLGSLLRFSLKTPPLLDWEVLKDRATFAAQEPVQQKLIPLPKRPSPDNPSFAPECVAVKLTLFDKLIPGKRAEKMRQATEQNGRAAQAASNRYRDAEKKWERTRSEVEVQNERARKEYEKVLGNWRLSKEAFLSSQEAQHQTIEDARQRYLRRDKDAIEFLVEEVSSRSEYPDGFPKECALEYQVANKTLVIDFELPDISDLPRVKEVKYVVTRTEFQESQVSEAWLRKTYGDVLYQISLRTMLEAFRSDEVDAVASVVFNGWVRSIDKSTGAGTHACIMTIEARKDEFMAINLEHVEPKACFKKLKGVSASKLAELSPVKPLVLLNRDDKRFVEGYAVADAIDERTNLAAMDWLDFENLIREVFEKEFSKGGGEVKITQASRDGGVDAIAFDPDPIRGGKIVIQAKRYTNTVGVSAVRDLFGTVHNEGANKGILVTTSDFGPDAYSFAKDKPITLITGAELLYLLSQHGHTAKIDLAEAKRLALE